MKLHLPETLTFPTQGAHASRRLMRQGPCLPWGTYKAPRRKRCTCSTLRCLQEDPNKLPFLSLAPLLPAKATKQTKGKQTEVSHTNKPFHKLRFHESQGKIIDTHCARKGLHTPGTWSNPKLSSAAQGIPPQGAYSAVLTLFQQTR